MNASHAQNRGFFAIAGDDSWAHPFPDVSHLLDHGNAAPTQGPPRGIEFFDTDGYRLAPVFDATWRLDGLARTTDPPGARAVRLRLRAVVAHGRYAIATHPDRFPEGSDSAKALPGLDGMTLPEMYA